MGFCINANNLASIRSFEDAVRHFNDTPAPRSRKYGGVWGDDCRPLYNTRSTHFRLERGEDKHGVEFYQCCLYQTPLVRYYRPLASGTRAVHIDYNRTVSSTEFLYRMGWPLAKAFTDYASGDTAMIKFTTESHIARLLWGDQFTARLILRPNGYGVHALDTQHSVTIPVFKRVSSTDAKERRAALRNALSVPLMLVEANYASLISNVDMRLEHSERFHNKSYRMIDSNIRIAASTAMAALAYGARGNEVQLAAEGMQSLVDFAMAYARYSVVRHASVTAREWGLLTFFNGKVSMDQLTPEDQQRVCISQAALRKSVESQLISMTVLGNPDSRTPYPMFFSKLEDTPRKTYTSGVSSLYAFEDLVGPTLYARLTAANVDGVYTDLV